MPTNYSSFDAPKKFWSKVREFDDQLHKRAPSRGGGWLNHTAECGWNRPYDGPLQLPEGYRILTLWEGQRRLGGIALCSGKVRIFTPAGPLTETGALLINEKRIIYDASQVPLFNQVAVYHHRKRLAPPGGEVLKEGVQHDAVGLEAIEKGLLEPTTVDYTQLLHELKIGASGVFMLPSDPNLLRRPPEEG